MVSSDSRLLRSRLRGGRDRHVARDTRVVGAGLDLDDAVDRLAGREGHAGQVGVAVDRAEFRAGVIVELDDEVDILRGEVADGDVERALGGELVGHREGVLRGRRGVVTEGEVAVRGQVGVAAAVLLRDAVNRELSVCRDRRAVVGLEAQRRVSGVVSNDLNVEVARDCSLRERKRADCSCGDSAASTNDEVASIHFCSVV